MGLFNLFSNRSKQRRLANDAGMIAQGIVTRYHQRKVRGEFRVDDTLYLELTQIMPEEVAQRIFQEFRTRRSHEHPKAEGILLQDIVTALLDAEHFASEAKPVNRPAEAVSYAWMSILERAYAKVSAGQPLTDAEENAIVYSNMGGW